MEHKQNAQSQCQRSGWNIRAQILLFARVYMQAWTRHQRLRRLRLELSWTTVKVFMHTLQSKNKQSRRIPKNWPLGVEYIRSQQYGSGIPANIVSFLKGTTIDSKMAGASPVRISSPSAEPSRITLIRLIDSPSHPAHGQHGLFAIRRIQPHTHILDYMGEVHADDREESNYDLSLYRSHDGNFNIGVRSSHCTCS